MKLSELAAKARRDPYVIEMDDDTAVSVAQPTIDGWTTACEAGDIGGVLTALGVGEDDAVRVTAALSALPMGTDAELMAAMRAHFQLGN